MIQARAAFISKVQTTFPPSKPVMELNQNHRSDHSLNIWVSLDLQPSIMYSPNLLIGPHLSPKSKRCWIWRLLLITKVFQNSISRRLRLWGSLVLTKSNHSWPFSKQNRKEKLEFFPLLCLDRRFHFVSKFSWQKPWLGAKQWSFTGWGNYMSLRICPKGIWDFFLVKEILLGLFFLACITISLLVLVSEWWEPMDRDKQSRDSLLFASVSLRTTSSLDRPCWWHLLSRCQNGPRQADRSLPGMVQEQAHSWDHFQ